VTTEEAQSDPDAQARDASERLWNITPACFEQSHPPGCITNGLSTFGGTRVAITCHSP